MPTNVTKHSAIPGESLFIFISGSPGVDEIRDAKLLQNSISRGFYFAPSHRLERHAYKLGAQFEGVSMQTRMLLPTGRL
ncbi:MAG: hypothetical protein Aurels2KO_46840 [Aureliella sp.]